MSAARTLRVARALLLMLALLGAGGMAAAGDERRSGDGAGIYAHWCQPCHGAGPGHPGTQALAVKYRGNPPAELEQRTDLTPEVIRTFVRQGVSVMAPFRKTEISDAELEALASWLAGAGARRPPQP